MEIENWLWVIYAGMFLILIVTALSICRVKAKDDNYWDKYEQQVADEEDARRKTYKNRMELDDEALRKQFPANVEGSREWYRANAFEDSLPVYINGYCDVVRISEGDTYWALDPDSGELVESTVDQNSKDSDWLKFYSEDAGEQYKMERLKRG